MSRKRGRLGAPLHTRLAEPKDDARLPLNASSILAGSGTVVVSLKSGIAPSISPTCHGSSPNALPEKEKHRWEY